MIEPEYLFPFVAMGHGDSFVIPTNSPEIMRTTLYREARKLGVKIKTSVRVEEGILCVRCWVVKDDERKNA